jgi:hypothetical protein
LNNGAGIYVPAIWRAKQPIGKRLDTRRPEREISHSRQRTGGPVYKYENILTAQVARIQNAYSGQILDESNSAVGCFLSEGSNGHPNADHGSNASLLTTACYVFLCDGSELEGNDELFSRIQKSIVFQRNWQRPTGLIHLVSINLESPPDTGFAVELFCLEVDFPRQLADSNPRVAEIAETLASSYEQQQQG